jgi:hypothetical protein
MVSPTKLARMDAKVRTFLAKEFATAPNYQAHVLQLWDHYRDLGLSNDDFVAELKRQQGGGADHALCRSSLRRCDCLAARSTAAPYALKG